MITLMSIIAFIIDFDAVFTECTDIYGRSITPNTHFIPGPDICQLCVCDNTTPKWCKRVLCSPPQNCKSFVMGSSCCDYSCLDNTLPSGEFRDEIDRRFVITIATAFLILTVLLVVIQKLRQRTLRDRIQNIQMTEDQRSIGSIGFITGSIGYLNLPNGHHFDDHPLVHFPVYKPNGNYFPRREAPPPYEEAVAADTALNIAYTPQLPSNERVLLEQNSQQRRTGPPVQNCRPPPIDNCICDTRSQNSDNTARDDVTDASYNTTQHRSIPSSICVNLENAARPSDASNTTKSKKNSYHTTSNRKFCPVHKKGSAINWTTSVPTKNDLVGQRRRYSNSSNRQHSSISNFRPNTCPPHLNFSASVLQHRTLPLSASLSSPLPSTSDMGDRKKQFATFSSAINISSSDGDESISVKTENSPPKPIEIEPIDAQPPQLMEDYHAECENCNLNVKRDDCDNNDEYFSEQETMTLQRKPEVSNCKNNEQVKVSLTLPTNSRSRRGSSNNQKCGRWNTKESPFKNKLGSVSSEDEESDTEKLQSGKKNSEENT